MAASNYHKENGLVKMSALNEGIYFSGRDVVFWHKPSHIFHCDNRKYKFKCRGKNFESVTQWMGYAKAMFFNQVELAENIAKLYLNPDIVNDVIKNISEGRVNKIEYYQKQTNKKKYIAMNWARVNKQFLEEGITARIEQNHELRQYLLNTKGKFLMEAGKQKYWSTGITIEQTQMMFRGGANIEDFQQEIDKNKAINVVASILMDIRSNLDVEYREAEVKEFSDEC